jgi:hypothetical protein
MFLCRCRAAAVDAVIYVADVKLLGGNFFYLVAGRAMNERTSMGAAAPASVLLRTVAERRKPKKPRGQSQRFGPGRPSLTSSGLDSQISSPFQNAVNKRARQSVLGLISAYMLMGPNFCLQSFRLCQAF